MEILEIHLKHFGKFEDQKLEFHPGLNVIYGENETGKSTICSFIRGMLFGIDRSRGRAARKDEYIIRQPWENPAYFAGSMRFTSGGKTFYLDRSFTSGEKRVSLICEDDGEELDPEQGDLDALLEDINALTYSNTFYMGNRSGETDAALAEEIHNYMVNASSGNFSQINITQACDKLKKERKELEAKKRQLLEDTTIAARELQVKMEYEEQTKESLQEEAEQTRRELEYIEERIRTEKQKQAAKLQDEREKEETRKEEWIVRDVAPERKPWIIGKVVMAILAALGLGIGLFIEDLIVKAFSVAAIAIACIGVRYFAAKDQQTKVDQKELQLQQKERELQDARRIQAAQRQSQEELVSKKARLEMNLEWITNSRKEKESILQELREEYEDLLADREERDRLDEEIAALSLAENTMNEVMLEVYQEYEDRLNERVSEILSRITKGKYDRILVDDRLEVKIYSEHRILRLEQVSRGTMEQICFALRMAVGEILNPGDPLPVILDDAFITYDDERLKNTLEWLAESKRQVLVFTCQKREKEIL